MCVFCCCCCCFILQALCGPYAFDFNWTQILNPLPDFCAMGVRKLCLFFLFSFFLAFQYPEPGFPDYFLSTSIKLIKMFQHQIHPGNKATQISHAIIFKLSENLDFVTILNIL